MSVYFIAAKVSKTRWTLPGALIATVSGLAASVVLAMSDYASMEKVGELGTTLPRNDERITTKPGDLILYLGNSFAVRQAIL